MIVGTKRDLVIENIKKNACLGLFNDKVELDDPILTEEDEKEITDNYIYNRNTFSYKTKTVVATIMQNVATHMINKDTVILGIEKLPKDLKGAIITSNHFSPLENTVIKHMCNKIHKKLSIISQTSNFKMKGLIGFLLNYANTIPINHDARYLAKGFYGVLKEKIVEKEEMVLLYPEQEMWFNYRKPRPPKKGAYFFASKLNVPIISCFVEMVDMDKDDTEEFKKVRYVLHILDVIYPNPNLDTKENSEYLASTDYEKKVKCYEEVYDKSLSYDFEKCDIAGWKV